jgi:hypothetical protein
MLERSLSSVTAQASHSDQLATRLPGRAQQVSVGRSNLLLCQSQHELSWAVTVIIKQNAKAVSLLARGWVGGWGKLKLRLTQPHVELEAWQHILRNT